MHICYMVKMFKLQLIKYLAQIPAVVTLVEW